MINPPGSIPVTNWDAARTADSSPGTEVPHLGYAHNLYLWSRAAACTYLVTARTKSVQVRPKSPSPSKEGASPRGHASPHSPIFPCAIPPVFLPNLSHYPARGIKRRGRKIRDCLPGTELRGGLGSASPPRALSRRQGDVKAAVSCGNVLREALATLSYSSAQHEWPRDG